jgi:excisionase family DNA binding protein
MAPRKFFASAEKHPKRPARLRERSPESLLLIDPDAQSQQPVAVQRPLLTVAQVRDYLNLPSDFAVYRLIHAAVHPLPHRRAGRSFRFDFAEVEQWTRRDRQEQPRRLVMVRGA